MSSWPQPPCVYVSDYDIEKLPENKQSKSNDKKHMSATNIFFINNDSLQDIHDNDLTEDLHHCAKVTTDLPVEVLDGAPKGECTMANEKCVEQGIVIGKKRIVEHQNERKINICHDSDMQDFDAVHHQFPNSANNECMHHENNADSTMISNMCLQCLQEQGLDLIWSTDMIAKPVYMGSFNFQQFSDTIQTYSSSLFTEQQKSDVQVQSNLELVVDSVEFNKQSCSTSPQDKYTNSDIYPLAFHMDSCEEIYNAFTDVCEFNEEGSDYFLNFKEQSIGKVSSCTPPPRAENNSTSQLLVILAWSCSSVWQRTTPCLNYL